MVTPARTNRNYGYQVWLGSPPGRERIYNKFSIATALHSEPFAADDVIYVDGFGGQRVYVVPSRELVRRLRAAGLRRVRSEPTTDAAAQEAESSSAMVMASAGETPARPIR